MGRHSCAWEQRQLVRVSPSAVKEEMLPPEGQQSDTLPFAWHVDKGGTQQELMLAMPWPATAADSGSRDAGARAGPDP